MRLAAGGCLGGIVVDVQGVPVAQAPLVLRQSNREVAALPTDRQGQFLITGLQGGLYQLMIGPQVKLLRLWAAETAPPQAKPYAVLVVDDQVVIRPMMYVALSYDHRLIDGAQAVRFLVRVKESLEDPERMLLDV